MGFTAPAGSPPPFWGERAAGAPVEWHKFPAPMEDIFTIAPFPS